MKKTQSEYVAKCRDLQTSVWTLVLLGLEFCISFVAIPTLADDGVLGKFLGNIVMDKFSSDNDIAAVVFPHWIHRVEYRCYACHPAIFEMRANSHDISMTAILAGEFCGRCHNGEIAFAVKFETCQKCHSTAKP